MGAALEWEVPAGAGRLEGWAEGPGSDRHKGFPLELQVCLVDAYMFISLRGDVRAS